MAHAISNELSLRGRFWLKHVKQWMQSDVTQSQYCRRNRISISAFSWWKRKFEKVGYFENSVNQTVQKSPAAATFTEIKLPEVNEPRLDFEFNIQFPNQISLRLGQDYKPKALTQLVDILVKAC